MGIHRGHRARPLEWLTEKFIFLVSLSTILMVFLIFLFVAREALPIFFGKADTALVQKVIPPEEVDKLSPAQLASVVFTVILSSFAVPGVPGGSIIAMVPVLAAVNLPIDGIGILLAVDTIPDMFRSAANATGSLTLAAALRRQT